MTAPDLALIFVLGVVLPVGAYRTGHALEQLRTPLPRRAVYLSVLASQILVLLFALLAAGRRDVPLLAFGPIHPGAMVGGLTTVAAAVFAAAWMLPRLPEARRRALGHMLPASHGELPAWAAISVLAGFVEELVYRWIFVGLVTAWTGSIGAGAVISAALFGLAHLAQGWSGVAAAMSAGLLLQLVVWAEDGLVTAMVLHAVYNTMMGAVFGVWSRSWRPEPATA